MDGPPHTRGSQKAPEMLAETALIVALILANGLFAGAEIAIVSLRRTRVAQLLESGRPSARALSQLRNGPERFLATVQIGITVVGTTAAAVGGSSLAHRLEPLVALVPGLRNKAADVALGIVVVLVSYLSLVLGELVPKSLALRAAEPYALLVARPVRLLATVARPLVWLLTASSNVILRPFSDRTNFVESRVSLEELKDIVEEASQAGAVHEQATELATRALEFPQLSLAQVMIPRNRIDALPLSAPPEVVRRFVLEQRRSRAPVYEGSLDNVVGYVSAKDIVTLAWEGRAIALRDVIRPVKLFPETVAAVMVLRSMQRDRHRLVLAVDEHGAVSGMVTFEDLVEELIGEVVSESETDVPLIEREEDGAVVVRGETALREINRELELSWPETDGASTIAGLASKLASGIPNRGARLAAPEGWVIEVLDATARHVRRVRLVPPPPALPAAEEA